MQNQEPTDTSQPFPPTTARISARTKRQAMDWSLVLASQGIESVIEQASDGGNWTLMVSARDSERAFQSLRQYQVENRGWPWRGQIAGEPLHFNWGCIGWAAAMVLFYGLSDVVPSFAHGGVMDSAKVVSGQWWRLFTAILLHADPGHLATNLSIGIVFLGLAMGRYGAGIGLLAAYLAGAGGNVASLLLNPKPFHGLGSSGMVMGALGLLVAQSFAPGQPRGKSVKYLLVGAAAGVMLFALLGLAPGTDMAAHLGGFVFGLLIGVALVRFADRLVDTLRLEWAAWFLLSMMVSATICLALLHP